MEEKFNVGDIVRLKSGGPQMTVESFDDDDVICVWYDGNVNSICRSKFLIDTLIR